MHFRQFLALFLALLSPLESFFASGANGKIACQSQEHLKQEEQEEQEEEESDDEKKEKEKRRRSS